MSQRTKLRGLFLNTRKANCSIHESGRMIYDCLKLVDSCEIEYMEVEEYSHTIDTDYDFFIFNYHHLTMSWLDTACVAQLPGIKMTVVLEVAPNDPFVLCPDKDFDCYLVIDPTVREVPGRVYAFPRPLEVAQNLQALKSSNVPIIGSFGFATPGKGFERVIEAVNNEFDRAEIRLNIPPADFADEAFKSLHNQNYAEYLANQCKQLAKPGIRVTVTHDYLSKQQLIQWCANNTLNCFLYDRSMPGLSATTDQAISSGRPLAVSENDTFRHVTSYITPYPTRSLMESIRDSAEEVTQMQQAWAPENFARKFEDILGDFNLNTNSNAGATSLPNSFELKRLSTHLGMLQKFKRLLSKVGLYRLSRSPQAETPANE